MILMIMRFRNTCRFLLAVICCPIYNYRSLRSVLKWIYHDHKAEVTYSLMTQSDHQPVIYWATKYLLAKICFDLNTQETAKTQVYPSDFSSFPPLHKEILPIIFHYHRGVYITF